MKISENLIDYLSNNIEEYSSRIERAIDRGYRLHLSPSQADNSLNDDIIDCLEEYADDYDMPQEELDELIDNIDDIYFAEI